jgi:hypothetical protein
VNPVRTLHEAVTLPFTAAFVVGICFFINWMTAPGHWWAWWVAFGMGIAVLCAWARAIKLIVAAGGLAAVGALLWKAGAFERMRTPPG